MELLQYLAASPFSDWLNVSLFGFPSLIALHSVGMGVVVGLTLMLCLRLHGVITVIEPRTLPRLLNAAVWGFLLNLVTGILIFITRGDEYIVAGIFLVKMLFVLGSTALLFWLRSRVNALLRANVAPVGDLLSRRIALVATVTWFAAVLAGRLIAYLSDLY